MPVHPSSLLLLGEKEEIKRILASTKLLLFTSKNYKKIHGAEN
jgi:hypothetical protein